MVLDIKEHLISRGMDPLHPSVRLDEENCIATFLLWNLSGVLVGYQQYNPHGTKQLRNDERNRHVLKYFTYVGDEGDAVGGNKRRLAVWGLESTRHDDTIIYLTEGVFDAVKLHALGLPAVAVLANDPKHIRPWLVALNRRVIAVCDNDAPGHRLGSIAHASIVVPTPYNDVGDMPVDAVMVLLSLR